MAKLTELFDEYTNVTYGLENIEIVKLDYFKSNNSIKFTVEGIDSLSAPNELGHFCQVVESNTGCSIEFVFSDSKTFNDVIKVNDYIKYLINRRLGNRIAFLDTVSYSSEQGKLLIYSASPLNVLVSSDDLITLSNEAVDAVNSVICSIPEGVIFRFGNLFFDKSMNPMTSVPEIDSIPDTIYSEYENYAPADYEVPPQEAPAMDDYYSYVPELSQAELDAIREQEENRNKPKKSTNKGKNKEEAEEEELDKNSWAYKAKQQKETYKSNKAEDSSGGFQRKKNLDSLFGKVQSGVPLIKCSEFNQNVPVANLEGNIVIKEDGIRLIKTGEWVIVNFYILDSSGGVTASMFIKPNEADAFEKQFKKGGYAGFQGNPSSFGNELQFKVNGIYEAKRPAGRRDDSDAKRVELHAHTKMSEKDAVTEPSDLMKMAASFGHPACAITDHGVVYGFPDAYNTSMKLKVGDTDKPFKAILGCEGYLVEDGPTIVYNVPYKDFSDKNDETIIRGIGSFVTVKLKTTGHDGCSDLITAVAASKYVLKDYIGIRPETEGESDEDAIEFSSKDIDKSLWNPEEIPETLRDENLNIAEDLIVDQGGHTINIHGSLEPVYDENDVEHVPDELRYVHVADFYAEVKDEIYSGSGDPCDSYFRMAELLEFIGDSYIAGDNIFETLSFLRRAGFGLNVEDHKYYRHKFLMPAISCEDILRYNYYDYRNHSVVDAIRELGCATADGSMPETDDYQLTELVTACRDAATLIIHYITEQGTIDPVELNRRAGHYELSEIKGKKNRPYHITFLARSYLGLYNLYHMVSESHVNYFSFRPRTPRSLLKYYSSGIVIGGACEAGEIYRTVYEKYKEFDKDRDKTFEFLKNDESFKLLLDMYDYVEVQPLCNNDFLTRQDPTKEGYVQISMLDVRTLNELLVDIADYFNKLCCATTDSHFLNKEDGMYRKLLLIDQGFPDAELQSDFYFRNTDEMLDEFAYLGADKAFEIVVTNTNLIADKIQYGLKPFPSGTYPPIIKRAAADVRDIAFTCANRLYRHNGVLNEVVKARLEKELNSIIGNGFAIMYYIAYRLVKKSNNDGYIVGSRGSVGSSFVATMCGISEVNPLPPHYRCPKCKFVEFAPAGEFGSGFDMEEKDCPCCGTNMKRDGQEIPFETFLGFFGDKQPDIDLNFSGEYQPRAHKYVEFLFGKTHTFRAGTIQAYQEKNAYGAARKAGELRGVAYSDAMIFYMIQGILGVKRTTSQHPGGIVVVPKEMDVYEFTPIQYPSNKTDCGIITTHFDFNKLHDTILKLDILGHADPTVLRMLQEITVPNPGDPIAVRMVDGQEVQKVSITDIPVPEPKVMSLLASTDALGFPLEATEAGSATLGLSELGTHMARGMIKEAKPTRFFDLVQLMGLSHGTDVWTGNAQDLIRDGICDLNSVIGCRDSIMTRLINYGLPNKDSFDIMEKVRKGKGLSAEHEQLMRDNNVPDWYIDSCKKIKYMFPKAHAAAYSISTLRVAWFKVFHPEEYYCAFFTIRGDEFHAATMCQSEEILRNHRIELNEQMHQDKNNPKTKSEYYLCEIVEEMRHRGIEFLPIDLKTSHATRFVKVGPKKILPPLNCIDSISSSLAESITAARDEAPFANREDLMTRGGVGKSALQVLVDYGLCGDLPESAQIDMFSLLGGT